MTFDPTHDPGEKNLLAVEAATDLRVPTPSKGGKAALLMGGDRPPNDAFATVARIFENFSCGAGKSGGAR
jgi:hypothetical protein